MKLYREVNREDNTNTGEPLSGLRGEIRLVLPIEIIEEEIGDIIYEKFKYGSGGFTEKADLSAKAIHKLISKGDD